MTQHAWLVLTVTALAYALTPVVGRVARRLGAIDKPGGRKVHERPTPLLGGVAIYAAVMLGALLGGIFTTDVVAILIAGSIVFVVGAWEDTRGVPALVRLLAQTASVFVLIRSGVILTFLPATWWGIAGEWSLTFLWVVGITNAFNFLDGLDGLATGSAAIHACFIGIYGLSIGQLDLALLALVLMGAGLGFLPHNYKPRRGAGADIFLGDSGSTFLGFNLAALTVMGNWAEGSPKDLIVPVLILAVPIFDMVLTTVVRFREGLVRSFIEWIVYTGRDHFHHRLLGLGMRKKEAVVIIYLVNLCLGLSAFLLEGSSTTDAFLVLGQVVIIFGITGYVMVIIDKRRKFSAAASTQKDAKAS